MNLKKLFIFFILFLLRSTNLYLVASEAGIQQVQVNNFFTIPNELLLAIVCSFDCKTMHSWKLSCKNFNIDADYKHILSNVIELEDYDMCTKGLIYFSEVGNKNNFKKLIQNNFDQRIADIKLLGWGDSPFLQEQMNAYRGIEGNKRVRIDYYKKANLDVLLRLIHINPNIHEANGDTPLLWASRNKKVEIARLLLDNERTDPNIPDSCGITALYWACVENDIALVKLLLNHKKTDPNIRSKSINTNGCLVGSAISDIRWQTLNVAMHISYDMKFSLNKKNVDIGPGKKSEDDNTALYRMCRWGRNKIVRLLLDNEKTDPNVQDEDGNTLLYRMCGRNRIKIINLLLNNKKTDLNIRNKEGKTALYVACQKYNIEVVKLLLDSKKINVNIEDKNRKTALDRVSENNYAELMELLIAKGGRYGWSARIRHMLSITLVIISMYALEWIINNHSIEEIIMSY